MVVDASHMHSKHATDTLCSNHDLCGHVCPSVEPNGLHVVVADH